MAILIVSVDFPPHTDGVSTVSHELATRLANRGENIVVIGPESLGDKNYDADQKFKVIRTPWYEYGCLRFIPIFFVMPFVIMKYRIKRVIAMNIAYGGVISYLFFRLLGFSYYLWAYGYEFAKFEQNPIMRKSYLKIYQNAVRVSAITDFVKSRLIRFGVDPEKIVVVKPGTDPVKFHPTKVDRNFIVRHNLEGKRIIMSVGRLIERKGIDTMIRALPDVLKSYPNVIYLVVGEGPFRQRLKEITHKNGVSDAVRFAGRTSEGELLNFYNLCDILVMASRTLDKKGDIEGFGIVFLEAGSCEKPVIGGLDGGMAEAIEDGVTGILVNSFDTKALCRVIIRLLSDNMYAKSLGKTARKRVLEEFNWERAVGEFYTRVLALKPSLNSKRTQNLKLKN